ncbi:hypothetical protein PYCCODRAFT_1444250 [Trametes coccinea BRFM310]|uniref:Uncharacterized protein n=1 Tax=Trametes coccinea (strain BRFM310) TaxID=1353009 RepID=A0A1Y2IU37_TRAC3|nr:hypothetical protein PYCCODRAFT_1444250 [Trametes coccinea BRFM310]
MSSFSSLSSICASPAPSAHQHRSDNGRDSRPSTPRIRTNTSHLSRTQRPLSSPGSGSRGRCADWDQQESLPSSSKLPDFSPRTPTTDEAGHAPRRLSVQTPPSQSKVRSGSSVGSSCNEVSPVFRVGGLGRRIPGIQAHQSEHAPTQRTTRVSSLVLAQGPAGSLNQAPSLSSSLTTAPSFTTPPTPQSQGSPVRLHHRRHSAFITPTASFSSLRSDAPSCELVQAQCEPSTPSPAPRSHASRGPQPRSRIRRGLEPPRARPTLAMSLQVHAPTPIMSTRSISSSEAPTTRPRSRSRPASSSRPSSPLASPVLLPQRPPMTRPPSRSERLLRDTLRRAEEQERMQNPVPSPSFTIAPSSSHMNVPPSVAQMFATCRLPAASQGGRRHRRNTSSSVQSESSCDYFDGEALDEESPEDEDDGGWMWRPNAAGSFGDAHGRKADSVPFATPTSPSPARAQLQRAAKSSPSVPRRHSHSQSVSHVAAHPPSRSPGEGERSACSCHQPGAPLTPHEAVLRSRLEDVLKNAKTGNSRTRSTERRDVEPGLSSGSGNSMASSRNLSGEGDFFFGANRDSSLTSLSSNDAKAMPATKPRTSMPSSPRRPHASLNMSSPPASSRHVHRQPSSPASPKDGVSPLTPPPSPPFNVRQAAAQIKGMDGYISFANIEGLGMPEGSDEESEEDAKSRSRWFQWLHLNSGKGAPAGDRSRGRSESASSASR